MRIIASTPNMPIDLEFDDNKAWQNYVGAMDDLRNNVMHPTRDLVGSHRSAKQLGKLDERLQSLMARAGKLISGYSEKWTWHT